MEGGFPPSLSWLEKSMLPVVTALAVIKAFSGLLALVEKMQPTEVQE